MRTTVRFVTAATVAVACSLAACGSNGGTATDSAGDGVPADSGATDGESGSGCSPLSPRSTPLQAWVAPSGFEARMDAFIDGAQRTLDVQMYVFTVSQLMTRVIAAKTRGVAVRVLLDPDNNGNITVRSRFTAAGVTWRNVQHIYDFAHAKYLIADGTAAVIMSANFDLDALSSERNYGVLDQDADDMADLKAIFTQDWAGAGGEAPQPADLACTRLVVSPTNSKARILDLIDSAQHTLDVEALYVTFVEVRDAIVAAKARGASVRVILAPDADTAMVKPYFIAQGIPVHDASGFKLHAKLLVADGIAFVGSENFSQTALTRNREVGVFVGEPAQNAIIETQFDSDWSSTN